MAIDDEFNIYVVKNTCRPLMRWSWIVLCLSGCIYQSYLISELFFEDAMVGESRVDFPIEIYPPAVTFCFQITDILRLDRIPEESMQWCQRHNRTKLDRKTTAGRNAIRERKESCLRHMMSGVNESHLLDYLTYNFEDVFEKVDFLHPVTLKEQNVSTSRALKQLSRSSVEEFFTHKRNKCFKLNILSSFDRKFYDRFELKMNDFISSYLKVRARPDAVRRVQRSFVFIHANNTRPRNEQMRVILEEKTSYRLAYRKQSASYPTGRFIDSCKDYTVSGDYESRDHYLSDCMTRTYRESNVSRSAAYRECSDSNPLPDCDLIRFIPLTRKDDKNNDTLIVSFVLSDRVQEIRYEQKITVREYTVYLCGVIGVWFGFNFMALWGQAENIVVKRKELEEGVDGGDSYVINDSTSAAVVWEAMGEANHEGHLMELKVTKM